MTHVFSTVSPALVLCTLASASLAGAPVYDQHSMYLRANFASNPSGAFNIPGNHFVSNETTGLNEANQISVRIASNSTGGASLWAGTLSTGTILYNTAGGALMGNATINETGRMAWHQSFSSPDGIYGSDLDGTNAGIVTNRPLGSSSYGSAQVNDAGNIGYRAGFAGSGNALVVLQGTTDTIIAAETGVDFMSPYSFIFTPSFNNADRTAVKVRIGPGLSNSRPDEIRLFETDGSSALIAADRDGDPTSPFTSFDNSVSLNNNGHVAFIAGLDGGNRGVFVSDGTTVTEIATEADELIRNIEFFAPDLNDNGTVTFRAFDGSGLRAIFAGNGDWLVRVVTENDILPTDLGDARVDQESSLSPVFGGGPTINNAGVVVFNCGLTPPANNQIEWGTGVFVAFPTINEPCLGDCDDSGTVDFNDLVSMLFEFGNTDDGACNADQMGVIDFNDLVTALFLFGPCN